MTAYFRSRSALMGFTIVEMLLVIALIGAIGAFMTTIDLGVVSSYRFVRDTESVLGLVRDAQHDASRALYGMNTGVYVDENTAVAYVGDSYAEREQEHDRSVTISTPIDAMLPLEIHFGSPSGSANEYRELLFTDRGRERQLIVHTHGLAYLSP